MRLVTFIDSTYSAVRRMKCVPALIYPNARWRKQNGAVATTRQQNTNCFRHGVHPANSQYAVFHAALHANTLKHTPACSGVLHSVPCKRIRTPGMCLVHLRGEVEEILLGHNICMFRESLRVVLHVVGASDWDLTYLVSLHFSKKTRKQSMAQG